MDNFVTRLNQDQVKEIANILMEPDETQGSVSYFFTGNHMVLEIVKNRTIDNIETTHVTRYHVYNYYIELEKRLLLGGTTKRYRELMLSYFDTPYAENYLFNY